MLIKDLYNSHAPAFFQQLEVSYHSFNLNRCDEKTFYISVELCYKAKKVLCDLIYIIDHPDKYGAISINKHYLPAKHFIEQHFHHSLMYSDEIQLAYNFAKTNSYHQNIQQFAKKYPKYMRNNLIV
ncbi:hypothetical protein ACIQ2D_01885 [Lysinibacillus sp. NPDC097287]|uniref:hypothetical protein n=1 Tax=Lysinibacillus sp. NPDC097287 TaxID=3364144 RepID=UPI00380A1F63